MIADNIIPAYDREKCAFFALGRNAMYAACRSLGLGPGDEVLTPAFDCDGALQPFTALGAKLRFYRSDPHTFSADIPDIKNKINSKTRLLHVINHFGIAQPWEDLLRLKNEAGIPVLEDNAYSLFSKAGDRPLGTFGDFSIFSLRKNLLLSDGAMLRVNNPAYTLVGPKGPAAWVHPVDKLNFLRVIAKDIGLSRKVKTFFSDDAVPPPLYSGAKSGYPLSAARDKTGRDFSCNYLRPMSKFSMARLARLRPQDIESIIKKKRQYYALLSERLSGLPGAKVLWPELPEGAVPFCLSLLFDHGRDALLVSLRKKYAVMAWPTLPGAVLEQLSDFSEVELLGRGLLQIVLPAEAVTRRHFANDMDYLIKDICAAV